MPVNCPHCRNPLADNSTFCSICGQALAAGGSSANADTGLGRMIPKKNPAALIAYYVGLGSCLCGLAGPVALYFGIKALREYKANPEIRGRTHAWVGIICGGLSTLVMLAYLLFMLLGAIGIASGHLK